MNLSKLEKINYQKFLDRTIEEIKKEKKVPTLLLHSCCAPCSTYTIEYLSEYFKITILYYNPNIYPTDEYYKRVNEQIKFIKKFPTKHKVDIIVGEYDTKLFIDVIKKVKNFDKMKEGNDRCTFCYNLRLEEAAIVAKKYKFDYFTTTLSVSPFKNEQIINKLGGYLQNRYKVSYLFSDFKKNNGYKRTIELSNEYDIYRQDFCGCIFSLKERDEKIMQNELEDKKAINERMIEEEKIFKELKSINDLSTLRKFSMLQEEIENEEDAKKFILGI